MTGPSLALPAGIAMAWAAATMNVSAADTELAAHARMTIGTGQMFRGLNQLQRGPSLSGLLQLESPRGWYGALWAGRVQLAYERSPALEVDLIAGFNHRLTDNIALDVSFTHYTFPTDGAATDWNELYASLHVDSRWLLAVGVGRDWLGADGLHVVTEFAYLHALPREWVGSIGLGYQQLGSPWSDYAFGSVGVARRFDRATVAFELSGTDRQAERMFGGRAGQHASASLIWSF
jgi:uncharacterized protein (TIGR02001 family)